MKRLIGAMALATGLGIAIANPAGALIIHGSSAVAIGNPDIRVAVDAEMVPCVASVGGFAPCIVEGALIIQIRVATEPARS